MATTVGTGTTMTFGTSSFAADLMSVAGDGIERPAIDTSHMGTDTWRTFIPGDLTDPGELQFEIQFDADDQPPVTGAAETITITFPSGATLASSGFVTSWNWTTPLEDKMMASFTAKLTGTPTWTDAA